MNWNLRTLAMLVPIRRRQQQQQPKRRRLRRAPVTRKVIRKPPRRTGERKAPESGGHIFSLLYPCLYSYLSITKNGRSNCFSFSSFSTVLTRLFVSFLACPIATLSKKTQKDTNSFLGQVNSLARFWRPNDVSVVPSCRSRSPRSTSATRPDCWRQHRPVQLWFDDGAHLSMSL